MIAIARDALTFIGVPREYVKAEAMELSDVMPDVSRQLCTSLPTVLLALAFGAREFCADDPT
jgi:hypothetical protein